MTQPDARGGWRGAAGVCLACLVCWTGFAQPENVPEPAVLRLAIDDAWLSVHAEDRQDERSSPTEGKLFESELTRWRPSAGASLRGSLYHPYLLEFVLSGEAGVEYEKETQFVGGDVPIRRKRDDDNPFDRYRADLNILKQKPYSVSLFASQAESRQDNDFYNRYNLESEEYGGRTGFRGGAYPFYVKYRHLESDATETDRPRFDKEETFQFGMHNDRGEIGRTSFTLLQEDFERREFAVADLNGTRVSATLSDTRKAPDKQRTLLSRATYNDLETTLTPSRTLTVRESLDSRHGEDWRSILIYNFSDRKSNDARSDLHEGRVSAVHQLYESLESRFEVDGRLTDDSSEETRRYGGQASEQYTKRLWESGRLIAALELGLHAEERDASGDPSRAINEFQRLTDGQVTFLRQPGVDPGTVVVTDASGTTVYREGLDYRLIPRGSVTQIERVVGGRIPNGDSVQVTYTSDPQGDGDFLERDTQFLVRLELLDRLLALYARRRLRSYSGGAALILNEVDIAVLGAELTWQALRAGIEYEDYDADISPFKATRSFQQLSLHPGRNTAVSLSARQTRTEYLTSREDVTIKSYIGRVRTRLARSLAWEAEAGYYKERGREEALLDRDTLTALTQLQYWVGRTTLSVLYEIRKEDFQGEDRDYHRAYVKVTRDL